MVKDGCETHDDTALQVCLDVREDVGVPWLDLYLPEGPPDPFVEDSPLAMSPSASTDEPHRRPPSERISARSFLDAIAGDDNLVTEATRLSKLEPTTVVLHIGNALSHFVTAGALYRLQSPTALFDDEIINAFILSLENQMAANRSFVFPTSLHGRLMRHFFKVHTTDKWFPVRECQYGLIVRGFTGLLGTQCLRL